MKKEYLLVLPIERFELGGTYPAGELLPLHCTVMHWFEFRIHIHYKNFVNFLNRLSATEFKGIQLISESPALFGPMSDVPVHTLKRTEPLVLLHNRMFFILSKMNALPEELYWMGAGWNPHVTDTENSFLPGSVYEPRHLMLIERINGQDKIVRARWNLELE